MAQSVSPQHQSVEAWVQSQACPCGICGTQKWHSDKSFSKYFGFPYQYHSTKTPHAFLSSSTGGT